MADDILQFLGLKPDDKEHPADKETLDFLGLKPIKDEHPAYVPYPGFEDPDKRIKEPSSFAPKSGLQKVHEAIDPATVVPAVASDIGGNIAENAGASAQMAGRGIDNMIAGQSATGAGEAALGTLGVPLSLITGPVKSGSNQLDMLVPRPDPDVPRYVTGTPTGLPAANSASFGDKAALMFPINMGGPALRTTAHNIHPTTKAADFIAEKVGPEYMPEVLARLRSNPRLRPIDVNDQLRMSGQGLVAGDHSPMASRTLTESMRNSAAGARDAVKGTYNEAMGAPPNLFDEYTRLQNKAQEIGKTKIQPPLDAAKPVDTTSVIADWDKTIKPGAQAVVPGEPKFQSRLQSELAEWRAELTDGASMLTDPNKLHAVQSEMRRRAEELSMNPETKRLGRQLYDYRNKLVDSIDAAAPGYKKGLEAYRDQKDIDKAFEFGRDVLKNTNDLKTDPSYLKQWVAHKDRTPEELDAARLGARQAIEAKMGSIKQSGLDPARSGTDVPQVEFNRTKLESLFGKEATDKMFKHLRDERDIALTNNRGLGNSKTAETLLAAKERTPRDITAPHSQLPFWAAGLGSIAGGLSSSPTVGGLVGTGVLGARAMKSGYDWMARRNFVNTNNSLADLLTRNDPETLRALSVAAQRIGQRNKLRNLLAPP